MLIKKPVFRAVWEGNMLELDFSMIGPSIPLLLKGMWVTIKITFVAILVGIIWGTCLAIFRLSSIKVLKWFATLYVNIFRSVPLLMVLMWFYLVVPQALESIFNLPPTTDIRLISALVAFSLFEASYYSEIMRAGIQSIPKGQDYAARALGMTKRQVLQYVILPQAFRAMIPLLLTQGIVLFQDTSLVYVISLTDFFRTASNIGKTTGTEVEMVLFAGAVYFIICFTFSLLVNYYKKRTQITGTTR